VTLDQGVEPLICFPDPLPAEWAVPLRHAGHRLVCVAGPEALSHLERGNGRDSWGGAVVCATEDFAGAMALCRQVRRREVPVAPLLLVVGRHQVEELSLRHDLFDDFCVVPTHPGELAARVEHLLWRAGRGRETSVVAHGPLLLNLETYQAEVAGRALDLTYMEYQLLAFLATHPGKVFTRETLLNRVWGYEYYGGARTVDVHVRRLRAKLGEEHAHLIQTMRSVGYRFADPGMAGRAAGEPDSAADGEPPVAWSEVALSERSATGAVR
jgi:DNA-binding response OmpR family regulator